MKLEEYKVIIITPEDKKCNLTPGKINYIGNITEESFHVSLLNEYGLETYGESSIFGILDSDYIPNVPTYFLIDYGNIVFLNISRSKAQKKGLLYLPDEANIEQIETLKTLLENLKDFQIELNHDIKLIDGIVESEKENSKASETLEKVLEYLNNIKNNNKTK